MSSSGVYDQTCQSTRSGEDRTVPQDVVKGPEANAGAVDPVLLARLRAQVEFYFSPQNLSKDKYLRSHIDSSQHNGAIPLAIIASFPKVRELCAAHSAAGSLVTDAKSSAPPADPALLQRALEGSLVVSVTPDGAWISPLLPLPPLALMPQHQYSVWKSHYPQRPSVIIPNPNDAHDASQPVQRPQGQQQQQIRPLSPSSPSSQTTSTSSAGIPTHPVFSVKERTTLVVRDIPSNCEVDKVMAAFTTETIRPKSAKPDLGNSWYVTFASEADVVGAIAASRERRIEGRPIRVRIKSEAPAQAPPLSTPPLPPQEFQQEQINSNAAISSSAEDASPDHATHLHGPPPASAGTPKTYPSQFHHHDRQNHVPGLFKAHNSGGEMNATANQQNVMPTTPPPPSQAQTHLQMHPSWMHYQHQNYLHQQMAPYHIAHIQTPPHVVGMHHSTLPPQAFYQPQHPPYGIPMSALPGPYTFSYPAAQVVSPPAPHVQYPPVAATGNYPSPLPPPPPPHPAQFYPDKGGGRRNSGGYNRGGYHGGSKLSHSGGDRGQGGSRGSVVSNKDQHRSQSKHGKFGRRRSSQTSGSESSKTRRGGGGGGAGRRRSPYTVEGLNGEVQQPEHDDYGTVDKEIDSNFADQISDDTACRVNPPVRRQSSTSKGSKDRSQSGQNKSGRGPHSQRWIYDNNEARRRRPQGSGSETGKKSGGGGSGVGDSRVEGTNWRDTNFKGKKNETYDGGPSSNGGSRRKGREKGRGAEFDSSSVINDDVHFPALSPMKVGGISRIIGVVSENENACVEAKFSFADALRNTPKKKTTDDVQTSEDAEIQPSKVIEEQFGEMKVSNEERQLADSSGAKGNDDRTAIGPSINNDSSVLSDEVKSASSALPGKVVAAHSDSSCSTSDINNFDSIHPPAQLPVARGGMENSDSGVTSAGPDDLHLWPPPSGTEQHDKLNNAVDVHEGLTSSSPSRSTAVPSSGESKRSFVDVVSTRK